MSAFVYAGSAQFLTVGMLSAGIEVWQIGAAVLLLNLRHVFFGLSFLDRYRVDLLRRAYLVFGLTDETYAILSIQTRADDDARFCLILTMLHHSYWIMGTLIGVIVGVQLDIAVPGLEFVLTCMFLVLVIEKANSDHRRWPFVGGAVAGIISILFFPTRLLLAASMLYTAFALFLGPSSKEKRG